VLKEKVAVYKQRQELEQFKSTLTCSKCKDPIKDFGLLGLQMPSRYNFAKKILIIYFNQIIVKPFSNLCNKIFEKIEMLGI
jgi:hypothetical protein